ncbi:HpcH/HpaI aldolase/citrate lyase family protein [Noviherbaspirillum sedimenti]|uniref:CoA ester lyase n=1 Tax=Noviherbaspirillum sedimenti TaxID=2320865 RepID=A0A3A3G0L4_9BURK|nr:aldolase/citrate lyase family protein [Noviherbaspirillum sedimenti]RJG00449.1 CoA ester lyase [Noviherbaspirillum sedimenti]
MHPSEVLFQDKTKPVTLPVCDHYAGSEKLMRKSLALQQEIGPLFDITFDCEDGAAAGNETAHAQLVGALIASDDNRFGRIGARVHDVNNNFFEQDVSLICATAAARLAYLMLPKAENLKDVKRALAVIDKIARAHGRSKLPVHVLIETHGALADVHAIAALPQVESLSFGIMDFVSAHYGAIPGNAMRSPGQFTHPLVLRAKLEIAAACHAHGKVPSHNVTTEIKDSAVVAGDATRAVGECGYTRMWSIHPDQIKPIIKAMTPRSSEVHEAAQILTEAQNAQWGPIQHHGRLHDRASYRYYWTILQRAKLGGMPLPEAAAALL